MNRETVTLQPAFVLHQRAYRDSSRLVDCLCRDHGRVALVARGARRPKSKLRSVLMPFQPLLISWVRRTDLGTLTGAEGDGAPSRLGGEALLSAYYVNELLLRLVQSHEPQEEVFDLYCAVLDDLASGSGVEAALRRFEKRLLDALGYGLSLSHEANSSTAINPQSHYYYRPQTGAVRAGEVRDNDHAVAGSMLQAIDEERFDDPLVLRTARAVLRDALAVHLGSAPLRVRAVARAMARGIQVDEPRDA
jgi:DNA repair protein RecO (recombination protein O)